MKKLIKNRYITLTLLIIGLLVSSCNPLDPKPTNNFTEENYWESVDNVELMVNMAYNQMYSADRMWNDEALSDNVFEGRSNTDQRAIRNGTADPTNALFASEWKAAYEGLKTCHVFLANVDRVPNMEENLRERRKAEIRFIRAYIYLRLVNFFGAVPFFTEDISLEQSNTVSRTPKAKILPFIHRELDEIIDLLPKREDLEEKDRGRITKAAAVALQARSYLYESNWGKVVDYCGRLMNDGSSYGNYALYPNYADLFTAVHEYNEEVILDYAYVPSVRTWMKYYDAAPLSAGARLNAYAPLQSLVDNYLTLNGKTVVEDPSFDENDPYKNRDPRMAATIVFHGGKWKHFDGRESTIYIKPGTGQTSTQKMDEYISANSNSTPTGYYIKKYYDSSATTTFDAGLNIIMLRYADILLMYAEAKFEMGQLDAAVWNQTIGALRKRAGFTATNATSYPATLNDDAMREVIRNERRSELALEGLRYFDIVRWKEGKKYLNGYVYGAKYGSGGTYLKLDNRKFREDRDYLWSVPQAQMDLNGNLGPNNPGYAN